MSGSDVFRLPDGRRLSFAEYGDPKGAPALFCHGAPGSRWQVHDGMAGAAARLGMRIVAPERPGYGLSDPHPERSFLDWPQDVSILMDMLGIGRFGVIGYSMGGIYALACGYALAHRVNNIALAGCLAPNLFLPEVTAQMPPAVTQTFELAREHPQALRDSLQTLTPEQLFAALSDPLPLPDKAALAQAAVRAGFVKDCEAALCSGARGIVEDFVLAGKDWNFSIEDVRNHTWLWHGEGDANTPPLMAEYLLSHLPNCHSRPLPEAGHLAIFSHWEDMLETIKDMQ
jgi:pimeloyl-ACP methyl ester carboxylesterase